MFDEMAEGGGHSTNTLRTLRLTVTQVACCCGDVRSNWNGSGLKFIQCQGLKRFDYAWGDI
jgi:hypothetical protein